MTGDGLPDREYLTVVEVATVLRLSKMTVYRLIATGELPSVRIGRSIRIPHAAAKALIEGGGGGESPRST